MRLAFIGGNGHHYLRKALNSPIAGLDSSFAVAGDGYDNAAARKLADSLPGGSWYDEPRTMLDVFKPDTVSVGAMYGHNGEMVAMALERDIPVVSDKPIAATWEQLQRLRELVAAKPSRVIVTEFDFRCNPAIRAAQRAVAEGLIGSLALAVGQKSYRFGDRPSWYADRASYGGTILWVASHAIDAIRFTTDQKIVRVSGRHGNLTKPSFGTMEDHTVSLLEFASGMVGVVHADYLRPAQAATHGDDRLRLAGSFGILEVCDGRCHLTTHDQPRRDITDSVQPRPAHEEIFAALFQSDHGIFGTGASLEMAAVLLTARDAADSGKTLDVRYKD